MTGPQARALPDGKRLHLQHGPIDLIIEAVGPDRDHANRQAVDRFQTILTGLVDELPMLRRAYCRTTRFHDATARRMQHAVAPFSDTFVTPMAAVAGAVADEVLAAMTAGLDLTKAYVNNGGDVAFHLARGEHVVALAPTGPVEIANDTRVRGMATSGWRGRSHSLGIADAVTVIADCAARADTAATLIANAVDLPDHPSVTRASARSLAPDSDLGDRPVTIDVGPLTPADVARALEHGADLADRYLRQGLIIGATLMLNGEMRLVTQPEKAVLHA